MSKAVRRVKKIVEKINHTSKLRTDIPAQMAAAAPPLGPQLGQRNINIAAFCKEFNEKTKHIKAGVPIPTRVYTKPDRSFEIVCHSPPATFLLKQAAGLEKGAMYSGGEVAGKITLKHLYEIAKIKIQDPPNALMTLEQMCGSLVSTARSCGIVVVRDLTAEDYASFMAQRKVVVDQQKKELQEKREAKMLRTG